MGLSGHVANLPCSLDLSVYFCYVSRATIAHLLLVICANRQKGLGDKVNLPRVRKPRPSSHLLT